MEGPDYKEFIKLAEARMPFGKYSGRYLTDLPEEYLIWLRNKGLPSGELGRMLEQIYEIRLNGLEDLVRAAGKR